MLTTKGRVVDQGGPSYSPQADIPGARGGIESSLCSQAHERSDSYTGGVATLQHYPVWKTLRFHFLSRGAVDFTS